MAFINGFSGKITYGGADFDVIKWTANISSEYLDTTNTGDAGWMTGINGVKSLEGSFEAQWDDTTSPTTTPGLQAGAAAAAFTLVIGNTGKTFAFSGLVTQISVENAATGVVTFNGNFKSTGAVTYPVDV